jgi:hypothetical protein
MKSIYSFLTVFILSCLMSIGAYADFGSYYLEASGNAETNVTRQHFTTPLTDDVEWTITAQTRYAGSPVDATWGSRLFHAYLVENPVEANGNFTSDNKLCFYMRTPVGSGGHDSGQGGRLLLANALFTPDVLEVDTGSGTLFTFQIMSDGTGTVLVKVFIEGNNDGQPYTKTYSNHEIGTIYGLAAGSNYDVDVEVVAGAPSPVLSQPSDLNFRTVLPGKTSVRPLTVSGVGLTGSITGALSGEDAAFFGLPTPSAANRGAIEVSFSPTEAREYAAKLTLSSPGAESLEINLTGDGNGVLPVTVSPEEGPETWYYIQFARRSGEVKVLTAVGADENITQSVLTPGNELQQWKISGDWDEYYFTNKSTELDLSYNATLDKYVTTPTDEIFGFVRYSTTTDWQVQNLARTFLNEDVPVAGKNYLNDYQGNTVGSYTVDDAGGRLVFIPVTDQKLFAGPDSIGFASVPVNYPSIKKQPVIALNLTGEATWSLTGDADVFSVTKTADTLSITFAPAVAKNYNALLTVSVGEQSHNIKLAGLGVDLPFKVSEGTNEFWYQIQFDRSDDTRGKAIQDNGLDARLTQEAKVAGQDNQLWKITGSWDKYKFIGKSGLEIKNEVNPSTDASRYVAGASGTGHAFRLDIGNNNRWELYDQTLTGGRRYVNDNSATTIGNWNDNDGGNAVNFLPDFASIVAKSFSFGEIEAGASFTQELSVSSIKLTDAITYALSGADAAAFTISVKEEVVEGEEEGEEKALTTPEPGTLPQGGGTLLVTFAPTEKKAYSAKLTFSATGADDLEISLTGTADFDLPVTISTGETEVWYYIQFKRRAADSKVLAIDDDGLLAQVVIDETKADETQHWKFTGTSVEGYQLVNKDKAASVAYDLELNLYELAEEAGDKHQFIRASNGADWQLYNQTIRGEEGDYLNDFEGKGFFASLYLANDAGDYLTFIPVNQGTAIARPEFTGDVVVATRYYTLQGVEVNKPVQTGIYIKQDFYASSRVKASKIYVIIK